MKWQIVLTELDSWTRTVTCTYDDEATALRVAAMANDGAARIGHRHYYVVVPA